MHKGTPELVRSDVFQAFFTGTEKFKDGLMLFEYQIQNI